MLISCFITLFHALYSRSLGLTYLTWRAKANMPAANGAEAEVPVWRVVHLFLRSVVALKNIRTINAQQVNNPSYLRKKKPEILQ